MLNNSVAIESTRGTITKMSNPVMSLRTQTQMRQRPSSLVKKYNSLIGQNRTKSSLGACSQTERKLGMTFNEFEVQPYLLESKLSQKTDFLNLSDGFKKIFMKEKKDKKMVLPIAGYGGHRRGDKSQNFFGKSFRESSL